MRLAGGLGNQLFQYFFGCDIALELKEDVQFKIDHRYSIEDSILSLFGEKKIVTDPIIPNFYWNLYNRIDHFSNIKISSILRYSNYYNSDLIGYDPKVHLMRDNSFFSGYFQTYRHLENIHQTSAISKLNSYTGSSEYAKMREVLEREKPIIVHIRRGDYRKFSKSIGLLSGDYYANAIKLAIDLVGEQRIYCMSDEDEFSIKFLDSLGFPNIKAISLPAGLAVHETLLLGTTASVNVMANSTFAWWSGYLNKTSIKIAPKKWFKAIKDPDELIPDDWHRVESSWDA